MSTKALKSQLLAAVAMVLVSSIALGSSTYAWFSLNTKVEATGMVVKTQVSNNLFIAKDTTGNTDAVGESDFTTSLVQNVDGILEPVSTVDGVKYFYTAANNAAVSGDALSDNYIEYKADEPDAMTAFNNNYQTTGAVGYVDYAFRLKAINTGATAQDVVLTGLNLVYGGSADAGAPAYRVAMFVQDATEVGASGAPNTQKTTLTALVASDVKGAYAADGFAYQTDGKAVKAVADADPDVKAIDSLEFNGTTINTANNSKIGTVAAGKTNYYKVVIRLWLEGEDKACTSTTFAALTDEWAMDVAVELKNEGAATTDGVAKLAAKATASKVALQTSDAVASTATYTIGGNSFYEITGKKLGTNPLYAVAKTPLTEDSKVYTVVGGYPIDVTNQVTITTGS